MEFKLKKINVIEVRFRNNVDVSFLIIIDVVKIDIFDRLDFVFLRFVLR